MTGTIDFEKSGGLIPAVIQDSRNHQVLMLGYMNREALETTISSGLVTFYSRSKGRLWVKGETSGNHLKVVSIEPDCDRDSLLIQAIPTGPVCHTGSESCFGKQKTGFLGELERIIAARRNASPEESYVARLSGKGLGKVAQKVGEEAVETVIAALSESKSNFLSESADLLFHFLVLLNNKDASLADVESVLRARHDDTAKSAE
jgi:phosphoribosyl-AMP cyclohydrolase / phosphoribosyl-ATP pyrophosphohydrolase